ncbi:MAG TPA: class I SAM-dependent methyltransferase [Allosphingosinicella sp.]
MTSDWDRSASAWLSAMANGGDWARRAVLDPAMTERLEPRKDRRALDVGCGEGRFCRILAREGIDATGIDPTEVLVEAARRRDPDGRYLVGRAESLPFGDGSFDLVVSYLSLIDIEDLGGAAAEMARVLVPGGKLLVANLASHNSAGRWLKDDRGSAVGYLIDDYLQERPVRQSWDGIDIVNWHRPLSTYMRVFLRNGLRLSYFDEPKPRGDDDPTSGRFVRAPWFVVMEWLKEG